MNLKSFIQINFYSNPQTIKDQVKHEAVQQQNLVQCDITTSQSVCINKGQKAIIAKAKPKEIIGYWSFDDKQGLDMSGNGNHAIQIVPSGPSFGMKGFSAYFNGKNYMEIPHSNSFGSTAFSLTFWIFFTREIQNGNEEQDKWCPIIQKGKDDKEQSIFERSPMILIDTQTKNIKLVVSTSDDYQNPQGEEVVSTNRIPIQRWTHIAVVQGERVQKIYINGILEIEKLTEGFPTTNQNPLYLGNTPQTLSKCFTPFYMDELRMYGRQLKQFEIDAEAQSTFGGVEPSFIQLGCQKCWASTAQNSCQKGYHLCTNAELHSGVLQVAKTQGWIDQTTHVWSFQSLLQPKQEASVGNGICCNNLS